MLKNREHPEKSSDGSEKGLTSDEQLTDSYYDEHLRRHSQSISNILRDYEFSYRNKVAFQIIYRKILFWGCSLLISAFTSAVICLLRYGVIQANMLKLESTAAIIASLVSLIVSILQLVHTITKYCFPEKDDEYILKIVDSIQKNDLERSRLKSLKKEESPVSE